MSTLHPYEVPTNEMDFCFVAPVDPHSVAPPPVMGTLRIADDGSVRFSIYQGKDQPARDIAVEAGASAAHAFALFTRHFA